MESVNASHGRSNSRSRIGAAVNPNTVDLQFNSKLPKLDFPVFKGNPVDWTTVWDQFKTSIHLNSRLSDTDKVNYLKKYLDGQALSAISGFTLSSENYHEAIDIFKNRFGNTQTLISALMETLLNVNKVRNFDDTIAVRKLYNDAETCMRNLCLSFHCHFKSSIASCLSYYNCKEIWRNYSGPGSSFKIFL